MATSSDKAEILALLKKYRAGECTPEETARIERWFNSFEEQLPDTPEMAAAANEAAESALQGLFSIGTKKKNAVYVLLRIAAVVIIACTGLLFTYRYFSQQEEPVTYAGITTLKGERKKITLPDGSVVVMNAGSELKIPSDFGKGKRVLLLSGQGFFDVKSNAKQPFIVRTGHLQTEVLGTSFDIRAYADEKDIQVAVLTGKVRVDRQAVAARQVLTYNRQQGAARLKTADTDLATGWQTNRFYFEQATLAEIAQTLERQYNVTIELNGKPKTACRYTIQLKNETIGSAMLLLAQLSGITYRIDGNRITINTTTCN